MTIARKDLVWDAEPGVYHRTMIHGHTALPADYGLLETLHISPAASQSMRVLYFAPKRHPHP